MNQNSIELIDYMGSDKLHGLAAWASTFAEFDMDMPEDITDRVDVIVNHILNNGKRKRSLGDLLGFLAEHSHTSPFRFSSFVFAATTDIATHIQKLKHKILLEAENGESARYKELMEDKFYIPSDWNIDDPIAQKHYNRLIETTNLTNQYYHEALTELTPVLGRKRAKETARYFKMYNSQINTLNKFSFDGIVQYHYKRSDKIYVQNEIADMSVAMVNCVKNIPNNPFKYSLLAFNL
jgi:thymidylate synthase ThyX